MLNPVEYWFNKIEDETIRTKALKNLKDNVPCASIADAIAVGFWWAHTDEGAFYWKEIHEYYS